MIKSVTITVLDTLESVTLELGNPDSSGFQVLGIDGLGPSKATINITEIPTLDGGNVNSTRVVSRNILFRLQLMEKPTIQAMRRLSYRYFPNKAQISILIDTEDRLLQTYGHVEDNDVNIFGADPEKANISVICANPYFFSPEMTTNLFSGIDPAFTFPFSNDSLVSKLLVFGNIVTNTKKNIYYDGDAEVGIKLIAHAIGPVTDPTFYASRSNQLMKILSSKLSLMGLSIIAGDDIIINSIRGQKSVTHVRAGVSTSILNALDENIGWPTLKYGDNPYEYSAASGITNLQLTVENQTLYSGV